MMEQGIKEVNLNSLPLFKCRCSSLGDIMGVKGLGKTGESVCLNYVKEHLYDRRKDFKSKYTDKGTRCEDGAIKLLSEYVGYELEKNDEWFEDDYFTGTPDLIPGTDVVFDVKNSWDCFTFPLFDKLIPTAGYIFQLQGYMALTKRTKAKLAYILMDAPTDIIQAEARTLSWERGLRGYIDDDIYQQVKEEMTYSHLPIELRVKIFEIERDNNVIGSMIQRVIECRKIIKDIKLLT